MKNTMLRIPMQFFAEDPSNQNPDGGQNGQPQQNPTPQIDYGKIAEIVANGTAQKESAILKSYFKQQGMSEEEMAAAISAYKEQKAKNSPDIGEIQSQLSQAQNAALQAEIQRVGTLEAISMGIDVKTVPYVLKMADMSGVTAEDGKINQESLKNAISKVLEDVPQLKPQQSGTGGIKFGADGSSGSKSADNEALKAAFGL